MFISFVTPTFNRLELLKETIRSVLSAVNLANEVVCEIVIVDDASSDSTYDIIKNEYCHYIHSGFLTIERLHSNVGVTGAKNYGARLARGEWIVFLDSDDLFIPEHFSDMINELHMRGEFDAIFYPCIDFNGAQIGNDYTGGEIFLNTYMRQGLYGEKLPVIKRNAIIQFPYEDQLRGFEGLTYFRMLAEGKRFYLSEIVVRCYRTDNSDRLSKRKTIIKKADIFLIGYKLYLDKFKELNIKAPFKLRLKIIYYKFISLIYKP